MRGAVAVAAARRGDASSSGDVATNAEFMMKGCGRFSDTR